MTFDRRTFIKTGAALGVTALGAPAIAQQRAKVKLGYLHTLAVDGQIWTGIDRGTFAKHNVEFEPVQFTTGLELFQAMIGGSMTCSRPAPSSRTSRRADRAGCSS